MEDPRQEFAMLLRRRREEHQPPLSQAALARRTRASQSAISRVETTASTIPPELPSVLDQVLGTDGEFKRLYEEVVAASFPVLYRRRVEYERQAVSIFEWSPTLVPGLLQTKAYAQGMFRGGDPWAGEREVTSHVEARIMRQKVLDRTPPPDVRVVLCESVIMRRVGSEEVMREQLQWLLKLSERPTLHIQILPLDSPVHLLSGGAVTILTGRTHVPVVCVEAYRAASVIEEPDLVRPAVRSYHELTSEAHSTRVSARLITEQIGKLS